MSEPTKDTTKKRRRHRANGMPRIHGDGRTRQARRTGRHYDALALRYDLADPVAKVYALGVADLLVGWEDLRRDLGALEKLRDWGRGRRPNRVQIAEARKRLANQWALFENSLRRLEQIAPARTPGRASGSTSTATTPAELLAQLRRDGALETPGAGTDAMQDHAPDTAATPTERPRGVARDGGRHVDGAGEAEIATRGQNGVSGRLATPSANGSSATR